MNSPIARKPPSLEREIFRLRESNLFTYSERQLVIGQILHNSAILTCAFWLLGAVSAVDHSSARAS